MSIAKTSPSTGVLFLRALLPIAILAGGIGGFIAISKGLRQETPLDPNLRPTASALVAPVRAHEGGMTIEADGTVVPYRHIEVSAEVSGRIVQRAPICRAGYYVKQGQLLVTIDPQDYQLEVDRLQKELAQAKTALAEWGEQIQGVQRLIKIAVQDLDLRNRELSRLQATERTAFSLSDLEKVEGAKLAAENTLETLRNRSALLTVGQARLESARDLSELQLQKARLDLDRTKVHAPADGVIVGDYIEEDSYVQSGTLLLALEDTAKAEVKCKLQMEDLYWLWDREIDNGQSAENNRALDGDSPNQPPMSADAIAYDIPDVEVDVIYRLAGHQDLEYTWNGRLERYDGLGLDEKTRTVPCRVVVDDPLTRTPTDRAGPPALLRGMYVTIRIHVVPQTPLLEIRQDGVRPGNKVWCVRDGKLAILPVNFVGQESSGAESSGESRYALLYVDGSRGPDGLAPLQVGDQVVITPLEFVRTGMNIEVSPDVEKAGS